MHLEPDREGESPAGWFIANPVQEDRESVCADVLDGLARLGAGFCVGHGQLNPLGKPVAAIDGFLGAGRVERQCEGASDECEGGDGDCDFVTPLHAGSFA